MADLHVNLPDSVSEFVSAQVATGRFTNASEYLGALVNADQQWQQVATILTESVPELESLLLKGLKSGEGRPWTPDVLDELKRRVIHRDAGTAS